MTGNSYMNLYNNTCIYFYYFLRVQDGPVRERIFKPCVAPPSDKLFQILHDKGHFSIKYTSIFKYTYVSCTDLVINIFIYLKSIIIIFHQWFFICICTYFKQDANICLHVLHCTLHISSRVSPAFILFIFCKYIRPESWNLFELKWFCKFKKLILFVSYIFIHSTLYNMASSWIPLRLKYQNNW